MYCFPDRWLLGSPDECLIHTEQWKSDTKERCMHCTRFCRRVVSPTLFTRKKTSGMISWAFRCWMPSQSLGDFSVFPTSRKLFFLSLFRTVLSAIHMQVTDRPSPDAPSLTQAIIVQMVYTQAKGVRGGRQTRTAGAAVAPWPRRVAWLGTARWRVREK